MIDKIEQYAMLKFAGDKEACAQFVEGFTKKANFLTTMLNQSTSPASAGGSKPAETFQHSIFKGMGGALGQGLGGLAVTAGVTSVGSLIGSVQNAALHSKFLQALERACQSNRILRDNPRERVLQYAETIFKFAPNLATDSNVLGSIVANAIQGEGVYPDTIKMITDIESRYVENKSFNPKTYSK